MTINWGNDHFYLPVPFGIVAVISILFILIACVVAGAILAKNTYACPNCGYHFRKKWYQMMFTVHSDDSRLLTCPKCRKKDFCRKYPPF